jgi:recombination protein RecT
MTKQTDPLAQSMEAKPDTMKAYLEKQLPSRIAEILPAHLKPDRFMRVAYAALVRTPKLQECTKLSVVDCLVRLSQVGLEPDGRMAHLIPFANVCTLVIDYKGLVDIVRRSGEVTTIEGRAVHKNDKFDVCFGSHQRLHHVPCLDGEAGEVVAAYSYVKFKDGSESFNVMSKREIDAIRKRSKSGDKGPWVTDYEAMAAKTAFRPHSKWLPFSPELREKIWADDDAPIDIEGTPVEQPRIKNAGNDDFAGTSFNEPEAEPAKEEALFV